MVSVWLSGLNQRSCSTQGPVSAWMGDQLRRIKHPAAEPRTHVNSAWAIPPWVGVVSTQQKLEAETGTPHDALAHLMSTVS